MITGKGTSANLGTLTNLAVLFLSSNWIYSGTSLSLLCKDPSITVNFLDFSLTSIKSVLLTT